MRITKSTEDFNDRKMKLWSPLKSLIMNYIDFRLWHCECHYQAPYGRVTHGGCDKHD